MFNDLPIYSMSMTSETFERALDETQQSLESVRERYEAVSRTEIVPQEVIYGIDELETELEELSKETNVTAARLEQAKDVRSRASLLSEAIEALERRQQWVIEQKVQRVEAWCTELVEAGGGDTFGSDITSALENAQEQVSILRQLLDKGAHSNVVQNKHVTPSKVENTLRTVDVRMREELSEEEYSNQSLTVLETFLDRVHEKLQELHDSNPDKTRYGKHLSEVKELRASAKVAIDSGDFQVSAENVRTAQEGAMMIDVSVAKATADQRLAEALQEYLQRHDLEGGNDTVDLASEGDAEKLLSRVVEVIVSEVEQSVETRIKLLLEQCDGSVREAVRRSDLSEDEFLEQLFTMYQNQEIPDLTVHQ